MLVTSSEEMEVINFAGKVPVNIFKFRRDKHDFERGWETEYLSELIDTLKDRMVVFDIGAENGEFTAMAAKVVGCEYVHIFEPSHEYWANIKGLWDANGFGFVGGCFEGYVGEKMDFNGIDVVKIFDGRFPEIIPAKAFRDTHHSVPTTDKQATISIDIYCNGKIAPNVIMMDIEGAELSALKGATGTIDRCAPIFFISIHNDQMIMERSAGTKQDIFNFFKERNYEAIHINTDHEEHWKFYKQK